MKYIILLFFAFILLSAKTFSQSTNDFDFIGTLILEDKTLITYRLNFQIEDNIVSGYSYTDLNGQDETKSKIRGTYDKRNKSIKFSESDILYTKSKELSDIFCFVNTDAKIVMKKNKNSIKGNFVGLYNDRDTCATGEILLVSLQDAFERVEKMTKRIQKIKRIDSVKKSQITTSKIMRKFKSNMLKENDVLSVYWKSKRFIMEIWDNGKEDGDLISIKFNDTKILERYAIKNKKKIIEIELKEGKNVIELIADSNGEIPPNSAQVILKDGEIVHKLSTYLDEGKKTKINIINNSN